MSHDERILPICVCVACVVLGFAAGRCANQRTHAEAALMLARAELITEESRREIALTRATLLTSSNLLTDNWETGFAEGVRYGVGALLSSTNVIRWPVITHSYITNVNLSAATNAQSIDEILKAAKSRRQEAYERTSPP